MTKMVRVNTRISSPLNEWLDGESEKTGIPKSTLVMLSLEQYRKERLALEQMGEISVLMDKLNKLEERLPNGK